MTKIPTRNPIVWFRIWRGWRRLDRFEAANVTVYRAVDLDDRTVALRAARRAARLAPSDAERRRFERWVEALKSGRRIKRASYPVRFSFPGEVDVLTQLEIDSLEPKE